MSKSVSKFEYPVSITTHSGSIQTGWSENQTERDVLLIGTFTEEIAECLVKLNQLYEEKQPIAALQFQFNLMLNFVKAHKQLIRSRRETYKSQISSN